MSTGLFYKAECDADGGRVRLHSVRASPLDARLNCVTRFRFRFPLKVVVNIIYIIIDRI